MKTLSAIFLGIFLFSAEITAQIAIFDGRSIKENAEISKSEKEFIEKEVRANEMLIKEIGEKQDFKCAEYSFGVLGRATGSFTDKNKRQKAYLYSICLDNGGKYASPLGGIIIVENQKTVAHFAYAHRWFDWIKTLPDINSNGFSELIIGFTELQGSLSFKRSAGIYEVKSNELENMAILPSQIHSQESDEWFRYIGYVKKGRKPAFYVDEYRSSDEGKKYVKTKSMKKVDSYKESERTFTRLDANQSSRLSTKDLSHKIIKLLRQLEKSNDLPPGSIEKTTEFEVFIDENNGKRFWSSGILADRSLRLKSFSEES